MFHLEPTPISLKVIFNNSLDILPKIKKYIHVLYNINYNFITQRERFFQLHRIFNDIFY